MREEMGIDATHMDRPLSNAWTTVDSSDPRVVRVYNSRYVLCDQSNGASVTVW